MGAVTDALTAPAWTPIDLWLSGCPVCGIDHSARDRSDWCIPHANPDHGQLVLVDKSKDGEVRIVECRYDEFAGFMRIDNGKRTSGYRWRAKP
jgi:hypothetical protein